MSIAQVPPSWCDFTAQGGVPVTLIEGRGSLTGTATPPSFPWRTPNRPAVREDECRDGIGALLRDMNNGNKGRDVQLACKRRKCRVCGPKIIQRKQRRICEQFGDRKMHRAEVDESEWETVRKALDRADALYHRVPAPGGRAIILTDADVGDVVDDRAKAIKDAILKQPHDGRRMTSSREWKGTGATTNRRWSMVGRTTMSEEDRLVVYEESGCEPMEVWNKHLPEDVVSAHDVVLPDENTPEMEALVRRLELRRQDDGGLGIDGWPVAKAA